MKTKEQRIDLLMKFMRGEVPASALKDHGLTWLHLMTPEQRLMIEGKVGQVHHKHRSQYNDNEPLIALWNGIPMGFTYAWHLSILWHPDSVVEMINCTNPDAFNNFLNSLPQKRPTNEMSENR